MKRKKWLLMTGAGLVAVMMLTCPAMAEDSSTAEVSITDNTQELSGGIYQLPESPDASNEPYINGAALTL